MALNLNESWNGEALSAVRELIQKELKAAFKNVKTDISNGKVTLTFTKGDGSTMTSQFTAAESSSQEGYSCDLRLYKAQSVYSAGQSVTFSYNFTQTLDGEEIYNVTPTITLSAYTVDSSNNPQKLLWQEVWNAVGNNVVTIPASVFEGIEGNILIKGESYVLYQGQDFIQNKSTLISIATCSLNFAQGFNLTTQVKGYANNASMNEVYLNYIGTYNADILVYIDGVLRSTVEGVISGTTPEITYSMSSTDEEGSAILNTGLHTCQLVARMNTGQLDTEGNPLYIYSNSVLFDFYKGLTGNHVGIQLVLNTSNIIESPVSSLIINTEQYVNTSIKYAASSYITSTGNYNDITTVSVSKGSSVINSLAVGHTEVFEYTFRDVNIPDKLSGIDAHYFYNFAVANGSRKVYININKNSAGVQVASGAAIDISASGRSNLESPDKINKWIFTDNKGTSYEGALTGFNFINDGSNTAIDGWTGESLKFLGNTELEFPYKPFESFNSNTGYYIEFNVKVNTVLDSDTYIVKAFNDQNKGGFYLKAEEAGIISESGTIVSTPIAAGNKYNIGFLIKKYQGTDNDNNPITTILLELFVNGIRSGVSVFSSYDTFASDATIKMNGLGAIWEFYGMRVYNTTLSSYAIYNNHLTTLLDSNEIVNKANQNNILNSAKDNIDFEALRRQQKNILVIEVGNGEEQCALDSYDGLGKMLTDITGTPTETWAIATKEQFLNPSAEKKQNYLVKGLKYYNKGNINDLYSFITGPTLMQVQGTSSTYYSRKNYDIFFCGQKYVKDDKYSKWVSQFFSGGITSDLKKPKYQMSANDLPVPCVCLKADYSDSSSLHNTQLTRLINDTWIALGKDYLTPPQYNNHQIFSEVRTGINGHPIDCFVYDGSTYTYIGKYNMDNEKKDSHHVFGFDGTTGNTNCGNALCIEFLENNKPATLFQADRDNFDWDTCASTTNDEGKSIPELEFRYNADGGGGWVEATSQERAIAKRPFIWVRECYDDWVNSYNSVTGEYTSSKFVEELTQYFNPHNLVSWYLYTEYFLAVDQRSKNMMLASWGATETSGIWYFLPYDGDTALGVTNDGWLIIPWDSDENTFNPMSSNVYVYMGHDSRLWELVRFYLYDDTYTSNEAYGLKGCSMIEIAAVLRDEKTLDTRFNIATIRRYLNTGRDYWADMIYNFDAETKYIAPLTWQSKRGTKSNFAQFIQGARDAHRDWLINKRFRMLDSKYRCGFFESDLKGIYFAKEAGVEGQIKIIPTYKSCVRVNTDGVVRAEVNLNKGVEGVLNCTAVKFDNTTGANLQGLYAVESLDYDTMAPYILSSASFGTSYPNLKRLIMNCPSNDAVLSEDVGNMVKFLPNLREFTMKGYPNVTGVLDLSNNVMLERVDIDCERLSKIILPYSHFNLTYFNVGKLNEWVPWEFWDELNEYHWRKSGSCIVVGELIEGENIQYGFKSGASYSNSNKASRIYVSDKFFVKVLPKGTLYGPGRDWSSGFFGKSLIDKYDGQPQNLKGILYAKIDYSRTKTQEFDNAYLNNFLCDCVNLEYINTRGWIVKFDENLYISYYGTMYQLDNCFAMCGKLKSIDLSFIDTTPGYFRKDSAIPNTLGYFYIYSDSINKQEKNFIKNTQLTSIEYVRYGKNYFNSQIEIDWSTKSNMRPLPIATQATLNSQTFVDLAEDLPDISGRTFNSTLNNTLNFDSTIYNDYTKFPQSVRDKITAKGWIIQI